MEISDAIAELAKDLDEWFEDGRATFAVPDRFAQARAIDRGIRIVRKLDRLKKEGTDAVKAILARTDAEPQETHAASLIKAFKFTSRLAGILHDELLDTNGETEVVRLTSAIVKALDVIDPARKALSTLLDDPNARVRASAGAYLINLMPDRVVPILREIEETEDANSAHFSASWTLLRWEREGRQDRGEQD
jgi:hypothetical protein